MLTFYLDHNKWIDLSRAAHGRAGGEEFVDAFEASRDAVRTGRARFVLDSSRYMELYKRAEPKSRWRLASTMAELSDLRTIAPQSVIVPAEIRAISHDLFGQPATMPTFPPVFGRGYGHAFGQDDLRFEIPREVAEMMRRANRGDELEAFERDMTEALELATLFGPESGLPPQWQERIEAQQFGQRYARGEDDLRGRLHDQGWAKGERLDRAVAASEMLDIREPLVRVARELGFDLIDALEDRDVVTRFIQGMPTRAVAGALRRARLANAQQRWKPNDLEDIVALSVAIPYCDVVVTERTWVHVATQSNLHDRFNTTLLSDASKLRAVLDA